MRTAAAKGKSSWRLIAAGLAVLVAASAAEASRFTPSAANNLLEKQGITSLAATSPAYDLATTFVSEPSTRFPFFTAADREALTAPLAGDLEAALASASADPWAEKLASGGLTWDLRPNLWRLHELTTISHQSCFGYARARWYDARNGAWMSPDPAQDVDSPNLYAYVAWQPHMATDPLGLCLGLNDMPCSLMAEKMVEELNRTIDASPSPSGMKKAEKVAGRAMLAPVTFLLNIGSGPGKVGARYEGAFQGHVPPMRSEADLRREINAAGMDFLEGAGDVAVVAPALRASGRVTAEVLAALARREGGETLGQILPSLAVETGPGTGLGPGAMWRGELFPGKAGRFSELDLARVAGDQLTPHHMPQAALGFTERAEGGALVLPQAEHVATRTYGFRGAVLAQEEAGTSFRIVLARDIRNVRALSGRQYNLGLRNLIDYYRTNFSELIKKGGGS